MFGSAGIVLASLDPDNLILIIGAIYVAVGFVCLAGWQLISRMNLTGGVPEMETGTR